MNLLILLLFTYFSASAHELCHETTHPELNDLIKLEKAIDWTAASDSQIRHAPCTRKNAFTDEEMKTWMSSNDSSPKINKSINGINFEDESFENLEAFRHLTTYVDILGRKDTEKHKDFSSQCKKVECAVKEILGNEIGLPLLYMQRRFGLNGSHIIKPQEEATAWQKSELDTVILALSDFPDGVMPIQNSRTMIHAPRNHGNGRTIANAVITIYELWNEQSPEQQRSTIVHELGHAIAGISDLDDHDHWLQHSGWREETKVKNGQTYTQYESSNTDTIISEYGLTNPHEDFAEAVVAYRYNPVALKEASPGKYNLIKEAVFDNVEYTSQAACSNPQRMSNKLRDELSQEISEWSPSEDELRQISNRCSRLAIEILANNPSVELSTPEFQNCYNRSVASQTSEILKRKIENHPNKEFLEPMLRNARAELSPEKVATIAASARNAHLTNLREQLNSGLADSYFCRGDFNQYAYQKFDEDKLGIDTYELRDQLNNISQRACALKTSGPPSSVSRSMFK